MVSVLEYKIIFTLIDLLALSANLPYYNSYNEK